MGRVNEEGRGDAPYRVNVGMEYRAIRATAPLIELTATEDHLLFRARFGLGLLMRPLRFERRQVNRIFAAPSWLSDCVRMQGDHLDLTVFTFSPGPLMLSLEELGYPVEWVSRR